VLTRLTDHGFTHHATPGYLAGDLDAVMPGPHLVSSLLKRWTAGTLHPDFDQLVRFLPAVEPVEDGSDIGG
jgi:hypothetical protein